MLQQNKLDL